MDCKDIHKLVSPFLDNELSATDTFAVADHLDDCPQCQRELAALQRLDERLKRAGHVPVDGVDELRTRILALLSPWTWVHRWRKLGAAAAVLVFLVAGRQLFSAPSDPEAAAFSDALIAEVQLNSSQPFSLSWLDPHRLRDLLRQEGLQDVPNLAPAGFHLEGARICNPLSHLFIQLVYRSPREEVSVFVSRRWDRPLSGVRKQDGFTIVPLGIRAVFLVTKTSLDTFSDTRQLAEEEVNALSS
jgi:anti-sigma factor RsiW